MVLGERFLTQPDLFPARMAGSPAGEDELRLDVAGGPYAVRGLSPRQRKALEDRYGPLSRAATDGSEPIELRVYGAAPAEFLDLDLSGKLNDFDFDYSADRVRVAGRHVMAQLLLAPETSGAIWTSAEGGRPFLEIFENCFRVCVAYRLLALGGALLHSAGIADSTGVWLLFGRSGVGKSTIARRSPKLGYRLLSDDLNAVLVRNGTPVAVPMPFAGDLRDEIPQTGAEFPIAGFGGLRQADEIAWLPLSPGRAAAALAACSPFINRDPHRADQLLRNLEALVVAVPVGELAMTLQGDFRPALGCAQR